jgi:hypothetical protein
VGSVNLRFKILYPHSPLHHKNTAGEIPSFVFSPTLSFFDCKQRRLSLCAHRSYKLEDTGFSGSAEEGCVQTSLTILSRRNFNLRSEFNPTRMLISKVADELKPASRGMSLKRKAFIPGP